MEKDAKIYIAGHGGLAGSAIFRKLQCEGYDNLLTSTHKELDLETQKDVLEFFEKERPEYVFLAAARVGGIMANNTFPADFIYSNLMIEANVINAAYKFGVKKLLFLGSSCIYPKYAPQPMKEEYLLTGELEPTNEPYAVAKIAGIKMCQSYNRQHGTNFISVMPTNLYGPNDNFDLNTSHVLPALIRKFHEAKEKAEEAVIVWGTGEPFREFLYSEDFANACVYLMERYGHREIGEFVNIGTGKDLKIKDLAYAIQGIVGFEGKILFDHTKPDGTPKKLLDVSRIKSLGWEPKTSMEKGIRKAYQWYKESIQR